MKMMFVDSREDEAPPLAGKLLQLNWPFLAVVTAITLIGVAALYSVAGGSIEPWASRHVVRYCIELALMFGIAFIDIRWWVRAAYPLYALAIVFLILVPIIGVESGGDGHED